MQLTVTKAIFGGNSHLAGDGKLIFDFPLVSALPFREMLAVEEHDGIGRRSAHRPRVNDSRFRPLDTALVFIHERRTGDERRPQRGDNRYDGGGRENTGRIGHAAGSWTSKLRAGFSNLASALPNQESYTCRNKKTRLRKEAGGNSRVTA